MIWWSATNLACLGRAYRALELKLTPTLVTLARTLAITCRLTLRVTLVQQLLVDGLVITINVIDRHGELTILRQGEGRQWKRGMFLTVTV